MGKEIMNNQIFLDDLPRYKRRSIDWQKCTGRQINFIYNNVVGSFEVLGYKQENHMLIVKYLEYETEIDIRQVKKCVLSKLFNERTKNYKYLLGEEINDMIILEKIRMKHGVSRHGNVRTEKGYKYKCLKCDYIGEMFEYEINRGCNCQVCSNRIIVKGINDVATTHPYLLKYFVNIEDAYKISKSVNKPVDFKCPTCGFVKKFTMNQLYGSGFSCNKCGDGISYPEKFMNQVLEQLKINTRTRKTFEWSQRKEYDFYIPSMNIIIETHGEQHYEQTRRKGAKTLEEEQENDRIKKELAIQNGIKEENYIVVDCRESELEWIKNNILNSKLNYLFDLSNVDWIKCETYALSSLVKKACDLWNQGYNTLNISEKLNLSQGTIINYLNKGNKIGLCKYSTVSNRKVEVYNLKNEKINEFNSIAEICKISEKIFGVKMNSGGISMVCTGKLKQHKGYKFKYVDI